jgi:malonate transporter MadL subunit
MLAACLLAGLAIGEILGWLIGVPANVGGVGFAMLLLILVSGHLRSRGRLGPITQQGIVFWSSIYIPVVVAMAASQDVVGAVRGGLVAVVAGTMTVAACFALVPILSRLGTACPSVLPPAAEDQDHG